MVVQKEEKDSNDIPNQKKRTRKVFKQLKLIDSTIGRIWNKKKLRDQFFFISTHSSFLKVPLQQFCKAHKIKSTGTKDAIVKRIWTAGFNYDDVHVFIKQNSQAPDHTKKMQQVERIQLKKSAALYHLCHLTKSLYNQANYLINTTYENETENGHKKWIRYSELETQLKASPNYEGLPRQVAQQCLRLVDRNWKAFFVAIRDWKKHPEKYQSKPEAPQYKPKNGEYIAIFTNQTARIRYSKPKERYYLHFNYKANLPSILLSRKRVHAYLEFKQARILPRGAYYILEIVYERVIQEANTSQDRMIAIDLGVRNTVTVVNNVGLRPFIVRGGPVKAVNQYYNKLRAKTQEMNAGNGIERTTLRIKRLQRTRNNKINDLFHKLSRALVNYCLTYQIGQIVIGYNEGWKQNCTMGKRNNQNFVIIPFDRLINQIQYKAELVGIEIIKVEENHTSKCSFLDNEEIEHHESYIGTRGVYRAKKDGGNGKISHGLFKTATGQVINSDVNGAYNIMRKAFPKAIMADGIEGLGLVPYSVSFAELKQLADLKSTHTQSRKRNADGIEVSGCVRKDEFGQACHTAANPMDQRSDRRSADDSACSKI